MMTKTLAFPEPALRAPAAKHLIFNLGEEFFGVPVLKVREIIRLLEITPVPRMPAFILGVINLRGKIVPVLDLRLRFDLAAAKATRTTCIIVTQVKTSAGKEAPMGLVVDGVSEVLNIASKDIEETPDFGMQLNAEFLIGIAKARGKVIALLDIDRALAADLFEKISQNPAAP